MSINYRNRWHDYTSRCIYMVTITKSPECPTFGFLRGSTNIPVGTPGSVYLKSSGLGNQIKDAIRNFPIVNPTVRILQYALMPDHLHLILFVESTTEEILGRIIARFKVEICKKSGISNIFEKGFNDQILNKNRKLDVLLRYLRENPGRLAIRRERPDFFKRVNELTIEKVRYQAYGNLHLLYNPFKEQVIVHRADNDAKRELNRELWLYTAANDGVLVSPFISKAEKDIRHEAETLNGNVILITNEPFTERYKPSGNNFALCTKGKLLLLSPVDTEITGKKISREVCLKMNGMAKAIAATVWSLQSHS